MEKRILPASGAVNHPAKKKLKVDSSKAPLSKPKTNSSQGKSLNKSSKNQKPNSKQVSKNVWWLTQKAKKQEKKNAGTTEVSKTVTNAKALPKSSKTEVGELKAIKKKALQLKKKRQRKNRLLKKKLKSGGNTDGVISHDSKANTIGNQVKKNLKSKDSTQAGLKSNQHGSELSPSVSLQKSGGQKQKRKKVKKFKGVKNAKDGGKIAAGPKETQVKGESTVEDSTKNEKDSSKGSQVEAQHASTKAPGKVSKGEVSSNWNAGTTEMSKTVTNAKALPKSSKTEVGELKAIKKKALQLKKKRQRKNRLLKKKLKSGGNTDGVISHDSKANTIGNQVKKNLKSKDSTQAGLKSNQHGSELSPSVSLQKSGGQKQKRKKVKKFKGVKNAKDGGKIAAGPKETQVKGESTVEDSTKNEKDSSKGSQVEAQHASTKAPGKVSKGEVSSNWNAGTTEMSKTVTNAKALPKSSKTEVGELKAIKKKALQLKKKRQRKNRLLKKKLKSGGNTDGVISHDSKANTIGNQVKKNLKSKDSTQAGLKSNQHGSELSPSVSLQKSGGQKQKRKKVKKFKGVKNAKDGGKIAAGPKETQVKGESTVEDSTKNEKDSSKGSQVEAQHASTKAPGKVSKGEVSSNWKALLPMVEKSRNERKKYKKKDKRGENEDNPKPSKPDIWFDDVDPSLIRANENEGVDDDEDDVQSVTGYNPLLRKDAQDCLTKCLAIDCEMVGTGPKGCKSILARVSIVNQYGYCVCDKYITPQEPVTDYRTFVSGIRPQDLNTKGESFEKVQKEVSDLLKGRIVVGHALSNDFKVLFFNHPRRLVRDTSTYQPFKNLFKSKRPGLKKLTELVLKVKVQKGEHNSVEDAQAAMKLYMLHRKQWEKSIRDKKVSSTSASTNKTHKLDKTTPT